MTAEQIWSEIRARKYWTGGIEYHKASPNWRTRAFHALIAVLFGAALFSFLVLSAGCGFEGRARAALEGAGFTHIDLGGVAWVECGESEDGWHFFATSATGMRIAGVVCCEARKGCTFAW